MPLTLKSYLNRPFPFIENVVHKIFISTFFSLVIFLFLVLFKPTFGNDQLAIITNVTLGTITILNWAFIMVSLIVFPFLFPTWFNPKNWIIKKTLIYTFGQIIVISILNYLFLRIVYPDLFTFLNLFSIFAITTLIGFVPTLLLIVYIEKQQQYKNAKMASMMNENLELISNLPHNNRIEFYSDNKMEKFELLESQLLYIKSEGNYVRIVYQIEKETMNKMLRRSLTAIEAELSQHDAIKKCHRSFLVNLFSISEIVGNVRNCNITFNDSEETVPVSRAFYKDFIKIK